MKGYTNVTTIENYLLTTIDSSFISQIEDWITDVEAYIENVTGRVFIADTTATVRRYDGDNTSILLIDDCVEVEEITIGTNDPLNYGESGVDDDFILYPANIFPKTKVKLETGTFPRGNQNIYVKAKWGYSVAVPPDIRAAATNLVAGIINVAWDFASEESSGDIQSMSIGRYSVTYKQNSTQAKDFAKLSNTLDHYKKYML